MPVASAPLLPQPPSAPEVVIGQPRGLAEEIGRLLVEAATPEAFYAGFLERVLGTLGATAGAVWGRRAITA